jgi:sulfatase maturation enzyme AslB (radical SAM superfamily)
MEQAELHFSPNLCITHSCNIDCVYCYQKHSSGEKMSVETARTAIDWIFAHVPDYADGVEIGFIGGEPLLEFELIQQAFDYVCSIRPAVPIVFFASTNATLLTEEMKAWFTERKDSFWLGLSLDGGKETHNRNRSNSFDKIDIDLFLRNWPDQDIKMTLSEYSLGRLAGDTKFIHSLGFKKIGGVNLAEGSFDWDKDEYIKVIIPQLSELVEFYVENDHLEPNQMFDKKLGICEAKTERKKWCGIGTGTPFFDVDGKRYPCSFITPMTFPKNELDDILQTDFTNDENFVDDDCFKNCYIYPICPCCYGANYMVNKTFKKRNRSKCRIQKLIALFTADMQAKLIQKNPKLYDDNTLYYIIEAIKKIRALYLDEFKEFL